MPITPNWNNAIIHKSGLYAVVIDNDPDMMEFKVVQVVSRDAPTVPWSSFAGVQVFRMNPLPWGTSFEGWMAYLLKTINERLREITDDPSPPPVASIPDGPDPVDFAALSTWFLGNHHFVNTPTGAYFIYGKPQPSAPDMTLPYNETRDVFGARKFLDGIYYERGFRRHADGRITEICRGRDTRTPNAEQAIERE